MRLSEKFSRQKFVHIRTEIKHEHTSSKHLILSVWNLKFVHRRQRETPEIILTVSWQSPIGHYYSVLR